MSFIAKTNAITRLYDKVSLSIGDFACIYVSSLAKWLHAIVYCLIAGKGASRNSLRNIIRFCLEDTEMGQCFGRYDSNELTPHGRYFVYTAL